MDEGTQDQNQAVPVAEKPEGEVQAGPAPVAEASAQQIPTEENLAATEQIGSESPVVEEAKAGKKKWMVVLGLVFVLGLTAVVLGFMSGKRAKQAKTEKQDEIVVAPLPVAEEKDVLTEEYKKQSTSDEVVDIEADLNNTSFNGLEAELTDIDKELSSE